MRIVVLLCALALTPFMSVAAPVVESVKGDVQASDRAVGPGAQLDVPTTVSTGVGAQAFLKFDDGTQIVLGENALLRVVDSRYTSSGVSDRMVLDLLRGSARVVTGKVAQYSPKQFFFRLPQAQLMVEQPSDFTVVLVNPAYVTVNAGSVIASNTAGAVTLKAGSISTIATNAAAATAIPASSLPPTAASSMSSLSVASVSAPTGGGASVGVAAGAAGTGGAAFVTPAVVLVGAAVAGAAAAVANSSDDPSTQSTATHH